MTAASQKSAWFLPLALLAAALLVMATVAAAPHVLVKAADQGLEETRRELTRLSQRLADSQQTRQEGKGVEIAGLLLEGSTTGIAAANLQKMMNDLVLSESGTPSRFQVWPPREDGDLARVDVTMIFQIDIDGLRDILHHIETGLPLLFIEEFVVQPARIDAQRADPYFLGPLEVNLRVSGFFPKKEAS